MRKFIIVSALAAALVSVLPAQASARSIQPPPTRCTCLPILRLQ